MVLILSVALVLRRCSFSRVLLSKDYNSIAYGPSATASRLVLRMCCSTLTSTLILKRTPRSNCCTSKTSRIPISCCIMPAILSVRDVVLLPSRQDPAKAEVVQRRVIRVLLHLAILPSRLCSVRLALFVVSRVKNLPPWVVSLPCPN